MFDEGFSNIEFASYGKAKNPSVKAYKLIAYYKDGVVDSCTYGFRTQNISLTKFKSLPEYLYAEAI